MTEGSFSIPRLHLDSLEYPLSSITIGCDELRFNLSNGVIRGSNRCHGRIPTLGQNPMSFSLYHFRMRHLILVFVHLVTTVLRMVRPGGLRSVVAESVLMKHQLLIVSRSRRRAPNLLVLDRLIAGFCSLWIKPTCLLRTGIILRPSTLLNFHRALVQRKYRLLFSPKRRRKPGPRGPNADLIRAVVDMKQHNPRWGCPRIAEQISLAFGISINKDVVRRILAAHYHPSADGSGPSWLSFIGHAKDSLHSLDLFLCESVALRTYWVLVVMDQYTRRIIGFGIHPESWMGAHCVGCSIEQCDGKRFRNI
jgi:putative transposase